MTDSRKRRLLTLLVVLVVVAAFIAWFAWYEFFREVPEAPWQAENGHSAQDMQFMYGSIGGERDSGIPYWIVYVLPRVFPDKLPRQGLHKDIPGAGGLAAFGLSWEQGKDLPIGFTTKTIGFKRVAQNCAACHTASYRTKVGENPTFVPTGPAHTFDLEAFFRFTVDCAKDPRFNAGTLMGAIDQVKPKEFSWIDEQIYRYVLIPLTRRALLQQEKKFAWIYIHGLPQWPDWGRGRDDAMNLTKYFLTTAPRDDTLGPTDMPSVWNLKKYKSQKEKYQSHPETRLNLAGDSWDANSVIIDSALGLVRAQPPSNEAFLDEVHWLNHYLDEYPAPKFPFPVDAAKAAAGKAVFDANCATCHASERTGTVLDVAEVGTETERLKSWNKGAAIVANETVKAFGIERKGLVEADPTGYVASFLDGIWLRAPYLHNGSVPTLADLLKPVAPPPGLPNAETRPKFFYRGYDLYDPEDVGFVSLQRQLTRRGPPWNDVQPPGEEELKKRWEDVTRVGTEYDVTWRSNSNQGHEFGVTLPQAEKDALLEYLKTL